jgi:hypothetical protein
MAGSRTLKLSILADVDNLKKELDKGSKEVEGFGGKLEKFSAAAKAAFLAAGAAAVAYAGKLAVEGVKAAIADEAAQKRLQLALENVTGATEQQIAAVEKQILKTSLATGVADDKLRPALQRLAVATGSVERSQELLSLALDISAATGKDVETVTNALAKAYEGNNTTLTRLGVGITATEAKTLGFEGTVKQLAATFGGAAATQADTFQGRIARLQVAFDETKETVGTALLPIVERLLKFITDTAIPAFQSFKVTAIDPVITAFERNKESLTILYNFIKDFILPILTNNLGAALKFIGSVAGGILDIISAVVKGIQTAVSAAISAINAIINAYNKIPLLPNIPTIPVPKSTGSTAGTSSSNLPKLPNAPSISNIPTAPSTVSTPSAGTTTPKTSAPSITNPTQTVRDFIGFVAEGGGAFQGRGNTRPDDGGGNITIVVQAPSAIDEEGFSRAVVNALNNSTNRGTTGGGGLRDTAQIL